MAKNSNKYRVEKDDCGNILVTSNKVTEKFSLKSFDLDNNYITVLSEVGSELILNNSNVIGTFQASSFAGCFCALEESKEWICSQSIDTVIQAGETIDYNSVLALSGGELYQDGTTGGAEGIMYFKIQGSNSNSQFSTIDHLDVTPYPSTSGTFFSSQAGTPIAPFEISVDQGSAQIMVIFYKCKL